MLHVGRMPGLALDEARLSLVLDSLTGSVLMVSLVRRIARAFGQNGITFKDQPNGRCLECRWNERQEHGPVLCAVPQTILANEICIQKLNYVVNRNIDYHLSRLDVHIEDDGEDWKNG